MIVSLGLHNTPQMQAKYEASESKLKKLQELSTSDKELIEKLRRRLFERKKQNEETAKEIGQLRVELD